MLMFKIQDSILQATDKLVSATKNLMRTAKTEEDLKIGFEKLLEPLLSAFDIKYAPKYEKSVYSGGRSDALHGQVIIEYEAPEAFNAKKGIDHAFNQLVTYIEGEAKQRNDNKLFLFDPKYLGVGFDGAKIFFVQYRGDKNKPKIDLDKKDFALDGPYPFDTNSARTLLTYLRSLSRKLLTAENLTEVFGPRSKIAPLAVSALTDALENWSNPRVKVFFNEWKRLFGIVYGEHFSKQQEEEAKALSKLYSVGKDTSFQELLFSVQTYFALLMKFIAADIITFKENALTTSFSQQLTHASDREFKQHLKNIEDGWIYSKRGITNYLEGDFFRWYLDAFSSPRLSEAVREITRALSDFEPATTQIEPESTRDLLKKLYQYLVPQIVRHKLGEYYTPDWLAELTLNEVGYDGNTLKRLLDPSCGSGTFLVLAIQRAKQYGKEHKEPPLETAKRIASNIWGFDMNPLAVIAARTNYLFALGELASELESFEIPVYLADSVLWPEQNRKQLNLLTPQGESAAIPTSIKTFFVPQIWIKDNGLLMRSASTIVESMVKDHYTPQEAMKRLKKEGLVFPPHEEIVESFYSEILELEKQGKNGIWARFLKNAFAPMMAEKFDYVIGNPPWIRWGYLSQDYRRATLPLWQSYGLFSLKGNAARLGGGEKDFSMLFTYSAIDYYLKKDAKLAFLITQEVFKSKGAGEGFRKFHIREKEPFKVLKVHDLVKVQPFEGVANKTAMLVVKKNTQTKYPIPYTVWSRVKGVGKIPTDAILNDAIPLLKKSKLFAEPIGKPTGSWQTITITQENLKNIQGKNNYQARRGASTEPYGVFWLELIDTLSDKSILIRNLHDRGKRDIPAIEQIIESNLVFPLVSGADINRWGVVTTNYLLMTQDPRTREPYPESEFKNEWPRTYSYLLNFKDILLSRGSKTLRALAERTAFYAMFGIGTYTVARYKVVWKRMSNDIFAAVITESKTPFGYKMIIPTDTTAFFAIDDEDEAHYLCSVINSIPIREFIKTYSSAGRGFGAPSVMNHVAIPKYDKNNTTHQKLSKLSKTLHDLKAKENQSEIAKYEKEVDQTVSKLFGLE